MISFAQEDKTHNYENKITELEKQEFYVFYCKAFIERRDIMQIKMFKP